MFRGKVLQLSILIFSFSVMSDLSFNSSALHLEFDEDSFPPPSEPSSEVSGDEVFLSCDEPEGEEDSLLTSEPEGAPESVASSGSKGEDE